MIRGSGEVTLSNFQKESAKSFGCGRRFGHSIEKWRTLIRQAWLLGFLHRKLSIGNGTNMLASIAFATFSVSSTGMDRLTEGQGSPVMLPMNPVTSEEQSGEKKKEETNTSNSVSKKRKGQGCHVLTTLKKLIADKEYWFAITNSDGYNYPGVFHEPYPKRLGYCEDITKLPNYDKIDPNFMFSDIQIGKGKARPKRTIKIDVAGVVGSVVYRFVPCGGVKVCGKHSDGCNFVTSTTSIKPCCQHSNVPLQRTGECPVVFIYVWPDQPEILKVAMLTTYKIDMSMTLEHMANREGMATNYGDSTKRKRRKLEIDESDKEGPPDKRKHFEPGVNISTVIFKCLSCSNGMD